MDLDLKGKVVIITGAGRGIGRAIARTFAQEGAIPVIADIAAPPARDAVSEIKSLGVDCLAIKVDISDWDSVVQMAQKTVGKFGRIDVLVNNAAPVNPGSLFLEQTMAEVRPIRDVIYGGYINCIRAVLGYMVKQQSGAIINILTDAARIGEIRMVEYGAAKAGIGGLSRGLAKEVAQYNIRINCVSPSVTVTERLSELEVRQKQKLGEQKFQEFQKKWLSQYPLKRFGQPEDIADAVVFLASRRASWITGQTLSVNGGYAIGPW